VNVLPAGSGLPGVRRTSREAPRYLHATVIYRDGRAVVEQQGRNDQQGRREMDRWCLARNADAAVDYIAVTVETFLYQEGGSIR